MTTKVTGMPVKMRARLSGSGTAVDTWAVIANPSVALEIGLESKAKASLLSRVNPVVVVPIPTDANAAGLFAFVPLEVSTPVGNGEFRSIALYEPVLVCVLPAGAPAKFELAADLKVAPEPMGAVKPSSVTTTVRGVASEVRPDGRMMLPVVFRNAPAKLLEPGQLESTARAENW